MSSIPDLLWGHSLSEYQAMFDLSAKDLQKPILDCASGFASFNATMLEQGKKVISCDPAYALALPELKQHITAGFANVVKNIKARPETYVWNYYGSFEKFCQQGEATMTEFLADYPKGSQEHRYIAAALPNLPLQDQQFKLALCAYFLFSSAKISLAFHSAAIRELCRVATEIRIFPLLDEKGEPAVQLAPIMLELQQANYGVEIKVVPYELQKGGNAMLRIWTQECEV